jgi:hypothetical protein
MQSRYQLRHSPSRTAVAAAGATRIAYRLPGVISPLCPHSVAWFYYGTDGSLDAFIASHIAVTVHVGNVGWPAGEWDISGQSEVTISAAGAINVKLIHATAENLCQTLS